MSVPQIINALEDILNLHRSLFQLALQKTDHIKQNDIEQLNSVIKDEVKHIQAVMRAEKDLLTAAGAFLNPEGQDENQLSLTACIHKAQGNEKEHIIQLKLNLENEIDALKQRNDMNQQLLEQSMQFVTMSLDLLSPKLDSYNYERTNQPKEFEQAERSVFDSKA
ncbi:hypothetical protein ABE29_18730 [Cytobacillus firmus]|uniref:flagellar protein FlgN n=1 Tax=Cytobacillus firmus TaxID=1399 RepID=UPI00077C7EDE|nr:flagellar protein FlgN [Cytobacillus firmus]MBG9544718.1 hypothetical protein [Cytobacillus firmus]MBG9554003.1 hypothetical protein [Cytobacillus firmus]MBG9558465.1 hypothetical protein [Cytobacillus firmus]MBG9576992.1 hypothetical protein [Cytobacillus firmus]MEC1894357.1 flagellar protein FlgN [Cytobacillus firmus]